MADKSIIVVGVDETASSRRALTWAAREAIRRGATLQVITAWTWDAVEGAPLAAVDPQAMMEVAEATQTEVLEAVLGELDVQPVVVREIVQSTASEALVEASRRADLVVVGTHGRGPVRSFLLGSVSQSVIRHAQCPVVVMPPVHEVHLDTRNVATSTS
jgi:nucleotide-binding universal stress UspA family protein